MQTQPTPLTPALFTALAQNPGQHRTTGVVIDGRPFVIIHL